MPRRRISHATGSSGIRMNPRWKGGNLYSGGSHARVRRKRETGEETKREREPKISASLNGDPTALIDAQWINNALTSYLAAASSYSLRSTVNPLSTQGKNTLLQICLTKVIIAIQTKWCRQEGTIQNGNAKKEKLVSPPEGKKAQWACFLGVHLFTPPGYYFTQQPHSLKAIDLQQGVPPSQLLSYKKS